jgi:hypothetical protein
MRLDLGVDGPRRSQANLIRPSREALKRHSTGIQTVGCPMDKDYFILKRASASRCDGCIRQELAARECEGSMSRHTTTSRLGATPSSAHHLRDALP